MAAVSLSSLRAGSEARVEQLLPASHSHDSDLVRRLAEIGFQAGEHVRVIARGRLPGEPIAVRLGRATFALRLHEAAFVSVHPC
jgi:ferrous iron transport protein A